MPQSLQRERAGTCVTTSVAPSAIVPGRQRLERELQRESSTISVSSPTRDADLGDARRARLLGRLERRGEDALRDAHLVHAAAAYVLELGGERLPAP